MPLRMWGIGSEPAESIETWARAGVDADRRADDDDAEVEGADQGRVDRDGGERRAVVGAGEVEAAGGVGEGPADPVAGEGVADQRGGRAAGCFELFGARAAGSPRAASIAASGQKGMPASLPSRPGRQGGRVGGDLLLGVGAGHAQVEGGVGAGGGVERAGEQAGGEGRGGAGGQGPPSIAVVDEEGGRIRGRSVGLGPGGDCDVGRVGAAGGRRDQGRALAFAQGEVEVGVEEAGKVFEGGDQAAGVGVGLERAPGLDEEAAAGVAGDACRGRSGSRRGCGRAWRGRPSPAAVRRGRACLRR